MISFFERSSFKLRCEIVIVIKHVAFFTICAKLTMAFTFTSLPLNFFFPVSNCGFDFGSDLNKNIGGSTDLVKNRHGSADLYTLIHSPRRAKEFCLKAKLGSTNLWFPVEEMRLQK